MKVVVQYGGMLIDARIEMRDGGETMVVVPVTSIDGKAPEKGKEGEP